MTASTILPSAIFPLHVVLIMKTKSEQYINEEIQAKNFKQWILKTILWRHYCSVKGLKKAILKDFWKNMGNLQSHTGDNPPSLPLPEPHQIVIYIGVFDLWASFNLNWISWIISLWQGKLTNLIKQGPIEQLFWVRSACYSAEDKYATVNVEATVFFVWKSQGKVQCCIF